MPVFESREALIASLPPGDALLRDETAFMHVLTHKDLHLHPVTVTLANEPALSDTGRWMDSEGWSAMGLPAPVRKLLVENA